MSPVLGLDPIFPEKMEIEIFSLRGMVVLDSLQILVPRPGIQPVPPALGKLIVLTTGPPGKPEEIQIFL